MNRVTRVAIFTSIAALGFASLSGARGMAASAAPMQASRADSIAVADVVNRFHRALSAGDSSAALSLLAVDAVVLESGGMESRSEYRSHHLPSDMKFAQAVKSVRAPLKVVVEGGTAWTVSTSTTQGQFNTRAINSVGAESMVLSKTSTGWKIRSIHWSSRNRRPST
ncbi:MAG TPA: nuclear transport factor 2 family protein [Gemmatimonadaceae bacterium]|nr:nuclear transport factor 2 family protein [Gemmatimonadaceae bacterium]